MKELSLRQKLSIIQTKLNCPKTIHNKFGDFWYRDLSGIYEALKPLLEEYAVFLVIDNELEMFGNTLFRKHIATLGDCNSDDEIKVHTYCQEALSKPKMSPEQASGSTSSFGNKYVLNAMFCLDDNKDADSLAGAGEEVVYKCPSNWGTYAGKTLKQLGSAKIKQFRDKLLAKEDITSEEKAFLEATK